MLYDYIDECDRVYPNTIDYETKKQWLDRLEGMLCEQLANRHPSSPVADEPYDDIYVEYLKMKCAEAMGDIDRFNNYLSLFNDSRNALFGYYLRNTKSSETVRWKNVL